MSDLVKRHGGIVRCAGNRYSFRTVKIRCLGYCTTHAVITKESVHALSKIWKAYQLLKLTLFCDNHTNRSFITRFVFVLSAPSSDKSF